MAATGTKAMEIMAIMVTITKDMEDMVAMITLVTTTTTDTVTTMVNKSIKHFDQLQFHVSFSVYFLFVSFEIIKSSYHACRSIWRLWQVATAWWSHQQLQAVLMGETPRLQVGM